MARGVAINLGSAKVGNFQRGSAVYRLWPSLGQHENADAHVVVAVTNAAIDHGLPETTVFKSDEQGGTALYGGLDGGAEALEPRQRIVGRHDHAAALANLAGGYLIVSHECLLDIQSAACQHAAAYARKMLKMTDTEAAAYASTNWGMFAVLAVTDGAEAATTAQHKTPPEGAR